MALVSTGMGAHAAEAQQLPTQGGIEAGTVRAEFLSYLMEGTTELLDEWAVAWVGDRQGIADLYRSNATLVVPGEWTRRSRPELAQYLGRLLPTVGALDLGLAQVDGADQLGILLGRYRLNGIVGSGGPAADEGMHVTVLWQEVWDWEIRSQILVSDPTGAPALWWQGQPSEPEPVLSIARIAEGPGHYPPAAVALTTLRDAWAAADLEALAGLLTDDISVRTAAGEYLVGSEQVLLGLWEGGAGFGSDLRIAPVDFVGAGQMAVLLGRFVISGSELDEGLSTGPVAVIFREEGGDWRIRTLFFASPG
jgi:ketosteroid isomerase-like protein